MRRYLAIPLVALALLATACGDDDDDDQAVTPPTTATQRTAEEPARTVPAVDDEDSLAREARELIDDVSESARDLVENPDADVDEDLADAERRARDLAARARNELDGPQARVGSAFGAVADQVAEAVGDLQDARDPAAAARIVERDLADVADRLREVLDDRTLREEARRQIEAARERLEELSREAREPG